MKDPEKGWRPDWGRGMDSEYSRMREVIKAFASGGFSQDKSFNSSRPPWRNPGRISNAVTQDVFWAAEAGKIWGKITIQR